MGSPPRLAMPSSSPYSILTARLNPDHCIDYLRQSFMCQPDLTPTVYHWNVEYRGYEIADSLPHQCVDFDLVYEWALSRNTSGDTLENLGPLPELDA